MQDGGLDHDFERPATEKEVVIYKADWGFRLPEQHQALLSPDGSRVSLSIPDRGGTYDVKRVEETHEEFRIYVAARQLDGHSLRDLPPEYPFPLIQDELGRLTHEYNQLRGAHSPDAPVGWAEGASHDSHTSWLRSEIRRLRREGA